MIGRKTSRKAEIHEERKGKEVWKRIVESETLLFVRIVNPVAMGWEVQHLGTHYKLPAV